MTIHGDWQIRLLRLTDHMSELYSVNGWKHTIAEGIAALEQVRSGPF